jgi:hypothetical protein
VVNLLAIVTGNQSVTLPAAIQKRSTQLLLAACIKEQGGITVTESRAFVLLRSRMYYG